jgi:hypothetical protein
VYEWSPQSVNWCGCLCSPQLIYTLFFLREQCLPSPCTDCVRVSVEGQQLRHALHFHEDMEELLQSGEMWITWEAFVRQAAAAASSDDMRWSSVVSRACWGPPSPPPHLTPHRYFSTLAVSKVQLVGDGNDPPGLCPFAVVATTQPCLGCPVGA